LNLVLIGVAGLLVAVLALVCCWAVRDSRGWGTVLLALMALAWAMPAPVIGIGLKQTIGVLIDWFPRGLVQAVLYDPYTPVPLLWAYLIRFLPAAVFLLWPAVRLVPSDLRETAQLEGARPRQELVQVFFPLTAVTFWWTAVAVAALALGEVGASDRVKAPGSETTVQVIFDRMHFGVENDVAALCLTLLALILIAGIVVGLVWKLTQPGRRIPPAVAQSELRVPR
jgi:iron(III) transport system permease protein